MPFFGLNTKSNNEASTTAWNGFLISTTQLCVWHTLMSLHDLVKAVGDGDTIREKIATGAKLDEADKLKRTPVHIAAWAGNLEALQMLVRAGAALDVKAMDGFTALHFAAQSNAEGADACIRFLVKKNKALLNMRITKGNKSALHLAAAKGNVTAVATLLELGADHLAKTTGGQTPADLAKTPEIKALLTAGPIPKQSKRAHEENEMEESAVDVSTPPVQASTGASSTSTATSHAAASSSTAEHSPSLSKKRPISEVVDDASDEV